MGFIISFFFFLFFLFARIDWLLIFFHSFPPQYLTLELMLSSTKSLVPRACTCPFRGQNLSPFYYILCLLCSLVCTSMIHSIPFMYCRVVPIVMDRAIKEIVSGIVQRSVSIATQTTKELVLKVC